MAKSERRVGLVVIAVIRTAPLAAVQVQAHSYRGEREPDVVTYQMKRVAPPRVPLHSEVVQDLLKIETDLEADLALVFGLGFAVTLGAVGDREEQPAQRPDVDSQTLAEPGELEIGRVDVVGVGSAG